MAGGHAVGRVSVAASDQCACADRIEPPGHVNTNTAPFAVELPQNGQPTRAMSAPRATDAPNESNPAQCDGGTRSLAHTHSPSRPEGMSNRLRITVQELVGSCMHYSPARTYATPELPDADASPLSTTSRYTATAAVNKGD